MWGSHQNVLTSFIRWSFIMSKTLQWCNKCIFSNYFWTPHSILIANVHPSRKRDSISSPLKIHIFHQNLGCINFGMFRGEKREQTEANPLLLYQRANRHNVWVDRQPHGKSLSYRVGEGANCWRDWVARKTSLDMVHEHEEGKFVGMLFTTFLVPRSTLKSYSFWFEVSQYFCEV